MCQCAVLCSVFQAEIYAILQLVKDVVLRQRHNDSIANCTDSQAALKVLSSPKVASALVLETMAALQELAILNSVRLLWLPGHYGILGNEIPDKLAKQASAQHYIGSEPVLGIYSSTVRNTLKQSAVWEQCQLWNSTLSCRQAKSMLKGVNLVSLHIPYNYLEKIFIFFVGLLTGHAQLNRHLTLTKVRFDPLCSRCKQEEETAFHLLARYDAISLTTLNHLGLYCINMTHVGLYS